MPRARQSRVPLRLYFVFFAGWVFASGLILRTVAMSDSDGRTITLAWFFVAGTGVLVVALVDRDLTARRETNALLADRQAVIESMGVVTDPRLMQLPLAEVLDELLDRVTTVLHADDAAVLLGTDDGQHFAVAAVRSRDGRDTLGEVVPLRDSVLGRVVADQRGVAVADVVADPAMPAGTVSLVAAPLVAEGTLLGLLALGTRQRRAFADDDLQLLQVVADRAAVAIDSSRLERLALRANLAVDGAQRRLGLLADAGAVLARSFESVSTMAQALGEVLVPTYVDWFAFCQLDGDGHPELVTWRASPVVTTDDGGDWELAVSASLGGGRPGVIWGDELEGDTYGAARERGLTSLLVAPVTVRSLDLAALIVGTAGDRRGLRPGDVSTTVDLAARLAVAIERVMLYGETQRSAARVERHAAQLQRLADAAFAVNAALASRSLATVVEQQAVLVFDADAAWVELDGAEPPVVSAGDPGEPEHRETAPITDNAGRSVGAVTVARHSAAFSREEQAVLSSLAQIASVALANARLYEDVQDSETRLRTLYEASPAAVVEFDDAGVPLRWNGAAEAILGWSAFEVERAGAPPVPAEVVRTIAEALAGERVTATDMTVGDVEAEILAVPLRDKRGVLLVGVDVTERKHVAEQLQQAQRMEAMARLAGGIAHDFNNVLMVISGYADLLLRRDVADDVRQDVESMRDAAGRAAEFTRKLLTISRRQVVQPQRVDVAGALGSLRDVLDVMVGSSVRLELAVDDPPPVLIDPAQFEQLVLNLAINARDAMPDGGTLSISATQVDGAAVITVGDTGLGMDAAVLEHCFEPFFTTKDRTKGTGLGLSTVYSVVTQAGGDIAVDSVVGEGTTFRVELPAAGDDVLDAAVPVDAGSLRVLLVDDEPDVRAVVADMLELDGHEVLAVGDGASALAQLEQFRPDVLLTDVVMPGMRGTELAEKAAAAQAGLRVIVMSSHVDDQLALDGAPAVVSFLAKPFSPRTLADALAAAAGSGRPLDR